MRISKRRKKMIDKGIRKKLIEWKVKYSQRVDLFPTLGSYLIELESGLGGSGYLFSSETKAKVISDNLSTILASPSSMKII